jgi:phosphoglycolate phosphatase-like HAD superfamily hydrolase
MTATALLGGCAVLVFDLDGTLLDTAADIRNGLNRALMACGFEPLAAGENPPDLHSPMRGIVQSVFLARGWRVEWVDAVDAVVAAWASGAIDLRREVHARLYPGVPEHLQLQEDRRCRMAVCTNKRQADATAVLARFGLLHHFQHVIGADTAERAKPDPAPLLLALKLLKASATEAVFFGDSPLDARCAQGSGVRFAWHRSGYGGDEVLQYPVAFAYDGYADLQPPGWLVSDEFGRLKRSP